MAVLGLLLAGCKKNNAEPELDDRLVGTQWETSDPAYRVLYGGTCYEVYEFVSTTEVECYVTRNGRYYDEKGTYTYRLNYPTLEIDRESFGLTTITYTFESSRLFVREGASSTAGYVNYSKVD